MAASEAKADRRASTRLAVAGGSAPLLIVVAAFSVQIGAAVATKLFDEAGPLGAVWLRAGFGALVLLALARGRLGLAGVSLRWTLALGLVLAAMNACFYESIARIPLGVAVTAEFVGPLAVAVAGSRRARDFLWVLFAAAGVALLGSPTLDVDPVGLGFALAAGTCWAAYIVVGKRLVESGSLVRGLTLAMLVAAALLAPAGILDARGALLDPSLLAVGLGVALLSSVVPYVLELAALRRVRRSTFGILLSLEPAVAALVGLAILHQGLRALEVLAVVLVVAASVGAHRFARAPIPPAT